MTFQSKYDVEKHPRTIAALARRGLTNEQIAHDLGISTRTLSRWTRDSDAVRLALRENKLIADSEVEDALRKRALGYTYTEKRVMRSGKKGEERIEVTEKEVAADVTACIFWLKNRNREAWRDVQGREITGADGKPLLEMTDEEALQRVTRILQRAKG